MPTLRRRRNRRHVVYQSLADYDPRSLPSGYLEVSESSSHPIHLRNALEVIREHDLRYRYRTKRQTIILSPMLKTMDFAPWTCFSLSRRQADDTWNSVFQRLNKPVSNRTLGSAWFEYFCFQRAEDLAMFRLVWG